MSKPPPTCTCAARAPMAIMGVKRACQRALFFKGANYVGGRGRSRSLAHMLASAMCHQTISKPQRVPSPCSLQQCAISPFQSFVNFGLKVSWFRRSLRNDPIIFGALECPISSFWVHKSSSRARAMFVVFAAWNNMSACANRYDKKVEG